MWSTASKGAELKFQLKMLTIVIETKARIGQVRIAFHVYLKILKQVRADQLYAQRGTLAHGRKGISDVVNSK